MGQALLTYRGVVYPWHCDHMGHMNVMWYVGKFDEATWQVFGALGLTPSWLRENHRGMATVEQSISYKKELMAGELVSVHSAILELKEKAVRFSHEMRRDENGEVAASTVVTAVHLDTQVRRACAFPPAVKARIDTFGNS
jgi:acyl-CoA thioester hydrolase